MMRRMIPLLLGAMLGWIGLAGAADDWPAKPVRIIVPAAAGGAADPISRVLADELGKLLDQRFYIENLPGANGNVGTAAAARSAADGYTLLFCWAGPLATNVSLYSKMLVDPRRDLLPIVLIGSVPIILVVNNELPVRTLSEFTAYARTHPWALNYGSTGYGSAMHLSGEMYRMLTGTRMAHIPYNSPSVAITDLITGRTQVIFQMLTAITQQVKAGQVRAIAILSSKRSPLLPEVPTTSEAGLANLESGSWYGLLAPNGTPPEVLARANAAVNKLLENPQARAKLAGLGMDITSGTQQQFAEFWDAEIRRWAEIIKFSGARIE